MSDITTKPIIVFEGSFRGLPAESVVDTSNQDEIAYPHLCEDDDYVYGTLAAFAWTGTEDSPYPVPCIMRDGEIIRVIGFSPEKKDEDWNFDDEYGPYRWFNFNLAMAELAGAGAIKLLDYYANYVVDLKFATQEEVDRIYSTPEEKEYIYKKWGVLTDTATPLR